MNGNGSIATSGTTMMTGMNTLGLVSLLAYTVRNITEMNTHLDEIREEIKTLKGSYVENTKRTHAAINKLNEKINIADNRRKKMVPEPKIVELEENENDIERQVDDVSAAISELMRGGK
jgi:hypothetical protein